MNPIRRGLLLLPVAALLFACASTPEATVQVFTPAPSVAPGTTYRFDRSPLHGGEPAQAQMEAAADALLARVGLRRDDAAPRLSVQLTATRDPHDSPFYGPYSGGPTVGIGIGGGSRGGSVGVGFGIPIGGGGVRASHGVDVLMRDLSSGQVVYQARASGRSGAQPVALAEAALAGFPNAPMGTRTVPMGAAPAR